MNDAAPSTTERTPLRRRIGQTAALFIDAYRQVNASALFWISLVLSAIVVIAIALPSIGPNGVSIFGRTLVPLPPGELAPGTFYKLMFAAIGLTLPLIAWLTIWANVLAIITTASIFPDLMNGGSIDLYLSKPISRLRLFLTKYLTGLVFMAVQVTIFCVGGFLVIGIRGGEWVPAVLLGIPLALLLFSYLWSISTLIGVWTRSTLLAVLLTILAWGAMTGVQYTEQIMLTFRTGAELREDRAEAALANAENQVELLKDRPPERRAVWESQLEAARTVLADAKNNREDLALWHNMTYAAYAVLPKTQGTAGLIERWIVDAAELDELGPDEPAEAADPGEGLMATMEDPETTDRLVEKVQGRSALFIIGTSLAGELVLLSIAAWLFVRRDY